MQAKHLIHISRSRMRAFSPNSKGQRLLVTQSIITVVFKLSINWFYYIYIFVRTFCFVELIYMYVREKCPYSVLEDVLSIYQFDKTTNYLFVCLHAVLSDCYSRRNLNSGVMSPQQCKEINAAQTGLCIRCLQLIQHHAVWQWPLQS